MIEVKANKDGSWNETHFDEQGRVTKIETSKGYEIDFNYEGDKTIVNATINP